MPLAGETGREGDAELSCSSVAENFTGLFLDEVEFLRKVLCRWKGCPLLEEASAALVLLAIGNLHVPRKWSLLIVLVKEVQVTKITSSDNSAPQRTDSWFLLCSGFPQKSVSDL